MAIFSSAGEEKAAQRELCTPTEHLLRISSRILNVGEAKQLSPGRDPSKRIGGNSTRYSHRTVNTACCYDYPQCKGEPVRSLKKGNNVVTLGTAW